MSKKKYRLFVALFPPEDFSQSLLAHFQSTAFPPLPPHRLIEPHQLHMTLAFLGDRSAKDLRAITESVSRSVAGVSPFTLKALAYTTIPTTEDGGPPKMIVATTSAPPPFLEVHRRLIHRLVEPKSNGKRPRFLPHLTLCRYQHNSSSDHINLPIPLEMPWPVSQVDLVSSTLTPTGSSYTVLSSHALED